MNKTINKIRERFFNLDDSVSLFLFNITALLAIAGTTVGLIFLLITGTAPSKPPVTFIADIFLIFFFCLGNLGKQKKFLKLASVCIVLGITLGIFPVQFFSAGGVLGGGNCWFIVCIVANFVLNDGLAFFAVGILQIVVIIFCYVAAYLRWIPVTAIGETAGIFVDIVHSIIIVSLIIGFVHKSQKFAYNRVLRKINKQNAKLAESEKFADDSNKAKTEFLANMSHEIRTPINSIIGMNEMILRESKSQNLLEYAQAVERSANMLLSLINDILDFSKIESGQIDILETEYQFTSVLVDCFSMINDRARAKGLDFIVRSSSTMPNEFCGDMVRVEQILINLLTNAVKYTERGKVELLVEGTRMDGGIFQLEFSVKDTGIGMTPESIEKLFDKFSRFNMERNRNVEGTGLGLSIVKGLVDMMGGEIKVSSVYGKGTEFKVILPQKIVDDTPMGNFSETEKQMQRKEQEINRAFHAPKALILVVDDVVMNLKVFTNLLKETKINIDTAEGGKECLEQTMRKKYDIIFMDHMMPIMNGIETFHVIKTIPGNKNHDTPVIMLTANVQSGSEEMYKSEGFSDYLSKPIKSSVLEEMILKYLPAEKIQYIANTNVSDENGATKENNIGEQTSPELQENPEVPVIPESDLPNLENPPETDEAKLNKLKKIVPHFDVETGLSYCGGSADFYIELLKEYCDSGRAEKLKELYENNQIEDYRIEAHSLKSTSRTLGLTNLGDFAEKLELAAKSDDTAAINKNHPILIETLQKTINLIKQVLG